MTKSWKPDWLDKDGGHELLAADIHRYYWNDWKKALTQYLANPKDPAAAVWFLEMHPANQRYIGGTPFSWFHENLWWAFVKVDPKTKRIETYKNKNWKKNKKGKRPFDTKRNTETNVWVEWGPYVENHGTDPNESPYTPTQGIGSHDYRVDTGAKTFERAMVNLAHNIWKLYGDKTETPDDAKLSKKDRW